MSSKRTTITINEGLYRRAQKVMAAREFDDFSGFVQQLIREEWERRHGPMFISETASSYGVPVSEDKPTATLAALASSAALRTQPPPPSPK